MENIGYKLKKIRLENNCTQEDIANKLHVTRQTVSKWENSRTNPDISTLKKICGIYDVNITYFISDNYENNDKENTIILFYIALITNGIICFILIFNLIQSSFFANSHNIFTWIILVVLGIFMAINFFVLFKKKNNKTHVFNILFPILLLILINNMI